MSTASKNSGALRPWYRPHASAIALAVIAAALLIVMNASRFSVQWEAERGWPWRFVRCDAAAHYPFHRWFSQVQGRPAGPTFSGPALAADVAIGAAIAAGVLVMAERRVRRQDRLTQISMREMMLLVTLLCVVIGNELSKLRRQRDGIEQLFGSNYSYRIDEGLPHWLHRLFLDRFDITTFTRARFVPLDRVSSLSLDGPRCGGRRLRPLANFSSLRSLALLSESVDDDSLLHVGRLPRLTWLSVASGNVTDDGLAHLSELSQLRFLALCSTRITGAGLRHLSSLRRLESLDLSDTLIDDDGLANLRELPALENLCLSSTTVGDRGLQHLASCRQLRVLDLAGTRITHRGLRALASLDHLEQLDVHDTCTSNAGVARLRAALPGCQVLSGDR